MADSTEDKETFARPPPRNQVDERKKRYNNIMVRCKDHGWECPSIQEKLRELDLKKLTFDELCCFHYHTAGGINFGNFKDKFLYLECPLDFFPVKGGLKKHNSTVQRSNNSRSRSRTKSPPKLIKYNPDPAQSKAILEGRLSNLELSQREDKLYKRANDEKHKKTDNRLKILEAGMRQVCHHLSQSHMAMQKTLASVTRLNEEPINALEFFSIESPLNEFSLEKPDIINKTFNTVKLKEEDPSGDFHRSERSTEASIAGAQEHLMLSAAVTPVYQPPTNF